MIKDDHKLKLIGKLDDLKGELEAQPYKERSLEIYLLNHVNKYLSSLAFAESAQDVDNAASIFSRFCTESMDWDMPLYKQCTNIAESGFKLAKLF